MKKFVLYTARFGIPARFNVPKLITQDVDKFCFTDLEIETGHIQKNLIRRNHDIKTNFYQIRHTKYDHLEPTMRQRLVKICIPKELFDNYEYSVYVDCKRPFLVDFDYLLSCLKSESDLAIRRHGKRDCVYTEGTFCIEKYPELRLDILKQLDFYSIENYPRNNGLYRTGLLFRRHTKELKEFSKLWWEQLKKYSNRDQISFPYVAWKYDMEISLYKRMK